MNSYSCDIIMFTIDIDTSYYIVVWLPQAVQELETESYVCTCISFIPKIHSQSCYAEEVGHDVVVT